MNKKGNVESILWISLALFTLLIFGMALAFGAVITDWVADIVTPEISNLGMAGNANLTQVASFTVTPINNIIQSFTWMSGIIYMLGVIGCLGLAFAFRFTGDRVLMSLFIMLMFILIIASIFMSNIYEDFYNTPGDVGDRLHENTALSWLILYSPLVMCIIGFTCGIIMFTGEGDEQI
jgi:hypothetical protein